MRTTYAAEPRSFDWHFGFNTKTYVAQPFPPIVWQRIQQLAPSSGVMAFFSLGLLNRTTLKSP